MIIISNLGVTFITKCNCKFHVLWPCIYSAFLSILTCTTLQQGFLTFVKFDFNVLRSSSLQHRARQQQYHKLPYAELPLLFLILIFTARPWSIQLDLNLRGANHCINALLLMWPKAGIHYEENFWSGQNVVLLR